MDPNNSAQDVHRCDLCGTAIQKTCSYCEFCHLNLCKPCIGDHIFDGYDKHKIVSFLERNSTNIYQKCKVHAHKYCKFQCKNCDILVCSSCMASEPHRGHIFIEISEAYKKMKEMIENDEEKLENVSLSYEEVAVNFENQLANLDEEYKKLRSEITRHGEDWHKAIDEIIKKMKTEIMEIKVNHRDILQKHLDEIKQKHFLLKQTLSDLRKITESNQVSYIIEYESDIGEFCKRQPEVKVTPPTFGGKPIDHEKLCGFFGQIISFSMANEENILSPPQLNESLEAHLDKLAQYDIKDSRNTSRRWPFWRTRKQSPRELPKF